MRKSRAREEGDFFFCRYSFVSGTGEKRELFPQSAVVDSSGEYLVKVLCTEAFLSRAVFPAS